MKMRYNPTDHAVERYQTRVGGRGNDEQLRYHATEWFNRALQVAEYIGNGRNETLMYRYKQYLIIVDKDERDVVTLSYYNQGFSEVAKEITDTIRKQLQEAIAPKRELERDLLIEMHREEIVRLQCTDRRRLPEIKSNLAEINRNIMAVQHSIYDIETIAAANNIEL